MRSVIDPGGQTVSAMDRLYLAAAVPTLIVWGEDDTIIPVSHAHAAHEVIEGSRLEIIEGVGHFPHVEAPERFVEPCSGTSSRRPRSPRPAPRPTATCSWSAPPPPEVLRRRVRSRLRRRHLGHRGRQLVLAHVRAALDVELLGLGQQLVLGGAPRP